MKLWPAFFLLPLLSCAHTPVRQGPRLFPFGTYRHEVHIQVVQPAHEMNLIGVIVSRPDGLQVVGLSPLGTTLFRIQEGFAAGTLDTQIYDENLRRNTTQVEAMYRLLRRVFTAPAGQTALTAGDATVRVGRPDSQGIYRHIEVQHPRFTIEIEVTDYEP